MYGADDVFPPDASVQRDVGSETVFTVAPTLPGDIDTSSMKSGAATPDARPVASVTPSPPRRNTRMLEGENTFNFGDAVAVRDAVVVGVLVAAGVRVAEGLDVGVFVGSAVFVGDSVREALAVNEALGVREGVTELLGVTLGLGVFVMPCVAERVMAAVPDAVSDDVHDGVDVTVTVEVSDDDAVDDPDTDGLPVTDDVGVYDDVGVTEGVMLDVAVCDGVGGSHFGLYGGNATPRSRVPVGAVAMTVPLAARPPLVLVE